MRRIFTCLALTLLAAHTQACASSGNERSREAEYIAGLFRKYEQAGEPGCAVGVVRDGAVLHQGSYGLADLERRTHIGPETIFNIASVSKQFTAFSIFLLEARGKLSLDDSVARYLPELRHYAAAVKLRHLLSHTSGLREYFVILTMGGRSDDDEVTEQEILQSLVRQRALNFEPGTEYAYSNSGYFVLAKVVERASGQRLHEFVKANIFDPLGMTSSSVGPPRSAQLATAYEARSDGAFRAMHVPWEQIGESGVHTSLNDLLRWDANFYTAAVGGKDVLARMTQTAALESGQPLDYAGGLVVGSYGGLPTVAHSGYSAGFRSQLLRFPEQRFSVALLCNRDDAEVERDAESIAATYLSTTMTSTPLPSGVDAMITPGSVDIAEIPAGAYRSLRAGSYLRLVRRDDAVLLQVGDHVGALEHVTEHVYAAQLQGSPRYVTGIAVRKGEPARLMARYYGKPVEYVHVKTWQPAHLERYAGTYFAAELNATYKLVMRDGSLALDTGDAVMALQPGVQGEFYAADWRTIRVPARGHDHFTFSIPELRGIRFERVRATRQ